jgi:hypothetical protein
LQARSLLISTIIEQILLGEYQQGQPSIWRFSWLLKEFAVSGWTFQRFRLVVGWDGIADQHLSPQGIIASRN